MRQSHTLEGKTDSLGVYHAITVEHDVRKVEHDVRTVEHDVRRHTRSNM